MPDTQRPLSALIALAYLQAMWAREGWTGALTLLVPLAIPLGMIWYAGTISRSTGRGWGLRRFDRPTPPAAIRALGWIFLLAPLAIHAVRWLRAS